MKEAITYRPIGILQKEDFLFFAPADIVYIEARRNNCVIYTVGRVGGFPVTSPINEVMDMLPQQLFCKIHRSYIVSLLHIKKLNKQKTRVCYLENKILPISPVFQEEFMEKLLLVT